MEVPLYPITAVCVYSAVSVVLLGQILVIAPRFQTYQIWSKQLNWVDAMILMMMLIIHFKIITKSRMFLILDLILCYCLKMKNTIKLKINS